jgi:hypothetical protein
MDAITGSARFCEILLTGTVDASRLHLCKLTLKVIGAREADDPPEIRFRAKFS